MSSERTKQAAAASIDLVYAAHLSPAWREPQLDVVTTREEAENKGARARRRGR